MIFLPCPLLEVHIVKLLTPSNRNHDMVPIIQMCHMHGVCGPTRHPIESWDDEYLGL